MSIVKSITNIFFPKTCLSCGKVLSEQDIFICHLCLSELPFVHSEFNNKNQMFNKLFSIVNIEAATSLMFFSKQGSVQEILHQLKYKNHQEIGKFFGELLGEKILKSKISEEIDFVIPIPLHPKKFKKRGYNQLTYLGRTLANKIGVEYSEDILIKTVNNSTQTKKNAVERRKNVEGIFKVQNIEKLHKKHFLLIDDVMTTGATIESATEALLKIPEAKVSVVTLAVVE